MPSITAIALRALLWASLGGVSGFAAESLSLWDWSLQLRTGGGYKDNILLSDFNKESSAFSFTELEFYVFRAPVDSWEFTAILTADDRRFWQSSSVDKEQTLLASIDAKKRLGENWKAGLNAQYFYDDQVFDASILEGVPLRIPAKGQRFSGAPLLIYYLPGTMRLELGMPLVRQDFEFPLDDYWELGPKLLFGWGYGHKSDFTVSVGWRERSYDERAVQVGEGLRLGVFDLETGLKHYWDVHREWRSRVRLGLEIDDANGSGFYSYRRWRASHDLDYLHNRFEASLRAKFLHYEFPDQFVAPPGRSRRLTELDFGLRVKQGISKTFSLFAEVEYERVLATDLTERYNTTTIWGGVEWAPK